MLVELILALFLTASVVWSWILFRRSRDLESQNTRLLLDLANYNKRIQELVKLHGDAARELAALLESQKIQKQVRHQPLRPLGAVTGKDAKSQ